MTQNTERVTLELTPDELCAVWDALLDYGRSDAPSVMRQHAAPVMRRIEAMPTMRAALHPAGGAS
jgi:hypothetical protein